MKPEQIRVLANGFEATPGWVEPELGPKVQDQTVGGLVEMDVDFFSAVTPLNRDSERRLVTVKHSGRIADKLGAQALQRRRHQSRWVLVADAGLPTLLTVSR